MVRASAGSPHNIATSLSDFTNGCHANLPMRNRLPQRWNPYTFAAFFLDPNRMSSTSLLDVFWSVLPPTNDPGIVGNSILDGVDHRGRLFTVAVQRANDDFKCAAEITHHPGQAV